MYVYVCILLRSLKVPGSIPAWIQWDFATNKWLLPLLTKCIQRRYKLTVVSWQECSQKWERRFNFTSLKMACYLKLVYYLQKFNFKVFSRFLFSFLCQRCLNFMDSKLLNQSILLVSKILTILSNPKYYFKVQK